MLAHEQPIPDKLSFKIGEVAGLVGVAAHVLRYWEAEFPRLRARKSPSGHRLYTRGDVERLRRVRALLHDRGYTLAGVRTLMREGDEAIAAVLAPRTSEVAPALDAARSALDTSHAEARRLAEHCRALESSLERARAELAFWRSAANEAERAQREVLQAVEEFAKAIDDLNNFVDSEGGGD